MQKAKIVVAVILAVLLLIIVLQNMDSTKTTILFISIEMPLAALLFVTATIGFLIGVLVAGRRIFRKN